MQQVATLVVYMQGLWVRGEGWGGEGWGGEGRGGVGEREGRSGEGEVGLVAGTLIYPPCTKSYVLSLGCH